VSWITPIFLLRTGLRPYRRLSVSNTSFWPSSLCRYLKYAWHNVIAPLPNRSRYWLGRINVCDRRAAQRVGSLGVGWWRLDDDDYLYLLTGLKLSNYLIFATLNEWKPDKCYYIAPIEHMCAVCERERLRASHRSKVARCIVGLDRTSSAYP
jgi:hypothetical protein